MTRARTKRPGTRRGDTSVRRKLPDDLPSAAAAALDDLMNAAGMDDEDEELLTIPQEAITAPASRRRRRARSGRRRATRSATPADRETVLPRSRCCRSRCSRKRRHLAAAQGAIAAAGHIVATGGAGARGRQNLAAIAQGGIDVVRRAPAR